MKTNPNCICYLLFSTPICNGYSVKTDLSDDGANSTLFMAKVRKSDSGNYTCSIGPNDFYTINVHVLNGECSQRRCHGMVWHCWWYLLVVFFFSSTLYIRFHRKLSRTVSWTGDSGMQQRPVSSYHITHRMSIAGVFDQRFLLTAVDNSNSFWIDLSRIP